MHLIQKQNYKIRFICQWGKKISLRFISRVHFRNSTNNNFVTTCQLIIINLQLQVY